MYAGVRVKYYKNIQMSNLMKILVVGAELSDANRLTYGHDEAEGRSFANALTNKVVIFNVI
jgi:hypothetical protein